MSVYICRIYQKIENETEMINEYGRETHSNIALINHNKTKTKKELIIITTTTAAEIFMNENHYQHHIVSRKCSAQYNPLPSNC